MTISHVIPVKDVIEHDVSRETGADCICGPTSTLEASDEATDKPDHYVFTHHALMP